MRGALVAAVAAGVLGGVGLVPAPVSAAPVAMDGFEDYDWWYEAMRIDEAHEKGATGKGVTVALIDTSVDTSVPELKEQQVKLRTNCRNQPARSVSGKASSHGTSMAALIVGSGQGNAPGGVGVAGVAPEARLLAYDATSKGDPCSGAFLAQTIDQAVEDGADIISMSLNWDDGIRDSVQGALDAGVVVVGGMSSNGGQPESQMFPAAMPGVVAVQAVDRNAKAWGDTLVSDKAVIAAPGVDTGSGTWNSATGEFDSLGYATGTSDATAIVSGALAAVKSRYPEATGNQLVQHLIHEVGGEEEHDWDGTYGFGIVSVTQMLKSDPGQWPDENPLLKGPRASIRDYPDWVSSEVEDPPGKGENAPTADDGGEAGSSEESGGSDASSAASGAASDETASGVPGWVWPVGGVAVLAVLAGAFVALRRSGSTS
jgi:subtilisin family serine protease